MVVIKIKKNIIASFCLPSCFLHKFYNYKQLIDFYFTIYIKLRQECDYEQS